MKNRSLTTFITIGVLSLALLVLFNNLDIKVKLWWWILVYFVGNFVGRLIYAAFVGVNISELEIVSNDNGKIYFNFCFASLGGEKCLQGILEGELKIEEKELRQALYLTLSKSKANRALKGERVEHRITSNSIISIYRN